MAAGVQMVLAMGYSVTVSAARLLMKEFYDQLFRGASLGAALRAARLELYNDKRRRAYYNQQIELEDWLLPVVYENRPQTLRQRDFTPEESAAHYAAVETRYPEPQTTYRFVGRDLDILEIERRLLNRRNILLLRGMGGAGKTTLVHHLAWWWQRTGFVDKVFYYGYDQRAWTRQQIMDDLGRKLLGEIDYLRYFQPLGHEAQQAQLAERLRATRHLLILDNLESITGAELAIQHTLPPAEQQALHRIFQSLADGQTLILLGSRGGEEWLQPRTFADNIYVLPGLDQEAASELADLILARHNAVQYRSDTDLAKLLKLLDGYPLALEVVLANLAKQTPSEVLATLVSGAPGIDGGAPAESSPALDFSSSDIQKKTESIIACIAYSHSNLSEEAQQLLLCLAPFTGVLYLPGLKAYGKQLQKQPALAALPFERWDDVLQAAQEWGLLAPNEVQGVVRIQPTLPYFLRLRLRERSVMHAAVERAFCLYYDAYGNQVHRLITSTESQKREFGLALVGLECDNFHAAIVLALDTHETFINAYEALFRFLEINQQHRRALELGSRIVARKGAYSQNELAHEAGNALFHVMHRTATCTLELKDFDNAQSLYEDALAMAVDLVGIPDQVRANYQASTYHQLGRVAEEQRQWARAEQHYQQALALFIEFNDRYEQAGTYQQLGRVAREQRQWARAEQHYQRALALFIEFSDRYSQASTYGQLGLLAQEQRQLAQAEQYYQQALAIKIESDDRYTQSYTYHQLGRVAQEQQQWTQAEQYYQRALALYIEFDDPYNQANTYHQLGRVAQEQRQWAQAEQYYQRALALFAEFNDLYAQAFAYNQLGNVAQEQRQWVQAEQHLEQALSLFTEFNDRYNQAYAYQNLGTVAQAQRQRALAEQHYEHALSIYIEFDDRYQQAGIFHNLGVLAQEQRQWARAEQHYQQALALFIEFNDGFNQAKAYHNLGSVAQAHQQWVQACQYLLQSLKMFRDYGDEHYMIVILGNLAHLWRDSYDPTLPAATAAICAISPGEMEALFRLTLADDKDE